MCVLAWGQQVRAGFTKNNWTAAAILGDRKSNFSQYQQMNWLTKHLGLLYINELSLQIVTIKHYLILNGHNDQKKYFKNSFFKMKLPLAYKPDPSLVHLLD